MCPAQAVVEQWIDRLMLQGAQDVPRWQGYVERSEDGEFVLTVTVSEQSRTIVDADCETLAVAAALVVAVAADPVAVVDALEDHRLRPDLAPPVVPTPEIPPPVQPAPTPVAGTPSSSAIGTAARRRADELQGVVSGAVGAELAVLPQPGFAASVGGGILWSWLRVEALGLVSVPRNVEARTPALGARPPATPTPESTVTAASAPVAFRGLYDEHHAFVWAVLRKLGVPERDAEDVMQEVFLVVYRRLSAFEGRSAWTTWLYGITTRVYWNYARRQRSRPQASASASSLRLVDPGVDPERFTQRREASAMLEALLGTLDVEKRTAYVLHTLEGLSAPQISVITGVKTRTIYSRLRAAKAQVEASARRVQARARNNDDAVRRLAEDSTAHPPRHLRARGWAALSLGIAGHAGPAALAMSPLPWLAAAGGLAVVGVLVAWGTSAPQNAHRPSRVTPEMPAAVTVASVAPVPAALRVPPSPPDVAAGVPAAPAPVQRAQAIPETTLPRPPSTEPTLGLLLGLLPRARLALKAGRAQDALALLRAHALAEPDSPLAAERTETMLLALCALDQVVDAKRLAQAHAAALPASCSVRR